MFKKMTHKSDWLRRQVGHGKEIQAVCSLNAEFTRPLWVFGMSSYDFIQSNEQGSIIACSYRCFTIVSKYIYTLLFQGNLRISSGSYSVLMNVQEKGKIISWHHRWSPELFFKSWCSFVIYSQHCRSSYTLFSYLWIWVSIVIGA